jgi:hypothetical protein
MPQARRLPGCWGAPGDDGPGDPIGRVVGLGRHERGPAREAASPDNTMSQFAGYIVNQLFSVGLSLDSAHSIVGEASAGDRVAAATDEVDRLIREIRDHVFAERTQGAQAGLP